MPRLLLTGANGHLGRRLLHELAATWAVDAVVRSARAADRVRRHVGARAGLRVHLLDPASAEQLAPLARGVDVAVHLIGTIRESRDNRYVDAHERPARALLQAFGGSPPRHLVYVSILGAHADSACRCLRARAAVEGLFLDQPVPATIVRVPMVLGEGDRASAALARRARARRVFLWRGASLEQPIYAGDLITALITLMHTAPARGDILELAGPESLPRHALVRRAAAVLGTRPRIHSLPLALGLASATLLEATRATPPVTRDMLRVLDHDDAIDPGPAASRLGLTLTALDTMLARCLAPRAADTTRHPTGR